MTATQPGVPIVNQALQPERSARVWVAVLAVLLLVSGCVGGSGSKGRTSTSSAPASPTTPHQTTAPPPQRAIGPSWRFPNRLGGGIEGYAARTSVLSGQSVALYVSTGARSFRVRAFRMGWYGGALGTQVWVSQPVRGVRQSRPRLVKAATRTWAAVWSRSTTVSTTGWPAGMYLLRLDAANGRRGYVPLAVRAASAAGKIVLVSPDTTWQAYNTWGCCDLYAGGDGSFDTRSRAVSFDRPYADEFGAGQFVHSELPVVAEAERLGLPLDYATDVDLHHDPHLLDGARAVVSMGHDEYYSTDMRSALTSALGHGTNVAFFGANAIFRRIRMEPSALGPDRIEVNYKVADEDPAARSKPTAATADWPAAPAADPESRLIGPQYACNLGLHNQSPGVVADPSAWVFAGVPLRRGQRLRGLMGPETDAVQLGYPTPRPLEILLHSPTPCPGGGPHYADTTYRTASSGGAVFASGTIAWACAIRAACGSPVSPLTQRVVRTVTDNVLRAFAAGPAGVRHPAHDNVRAVLGEG